MSLDPCGWCRGAMGDDGLCTVCHETERDFWQEYKDDVAMGRIHEDGSYREPDLEPDFDGPGGAA